MPPDPNDVVEDSINPNYADHHGLPYKGKVDKEMDSHAYPEVDYEKS